MINRDVPALHVHMPSSAERGGGGPARNRAAYALLLIAFAFTVMADPISSVAYAIEAALRALGGNLALLLPTMALVIVVIAIVTLNYHQLVARFPDGGGSAAAAGAAFGEAWAFLPIGALVVDFVLTIAISVAAGSSAIVAYFPWLAPVRVLVALGLLVLVAGLTWFGHGGRTIFALLTLAFVGTGIALLISGVLPVPHAGPVGLTLRTRATSGWASWLSVALAFPVAMALATGVEAPSSAIAQLGQLDKRGRKQFGQVTLWLTLLIVGVLTLGLTALAVHLDIGVPPRNSTQIAELARVAGSPVLFATFQLTTTLLLLSAASSSFQAGPGLLKALARHPGTTDLRQGGMLPTWMGRINRHFTPYWGVVLYLLIAAAVVIAVDAQDQQLVLFYAVAVFVGFLMGLLAMVQFSRRERRLISLAVNMLGTVVVSFTLVMNLLRGWPLLSLAAAMGVASVLWVLWVRAGRPRGISMAVQQAEAWEEESLPQAEPKDVTDHHDSSSGGEQIEQDQTGGTHACQASQEEQAEASPPGETGA
jgi:amino acid transporter